MSSTVRPTCQYIIDFVRTLILDDEPDGQFTDSDIQQRLDLNRVDVYTQALTAAETLVPMGPQGRIEWHDFYAAYDWWEEDSYVQLATGVVLTPDAVDFQIGRWHFDTTLHTLPVMVTGRAFNVYGTASKLLFQIEATLRNQFNFTADGLTVQRIAQVQDIHNLAITYANMGWGAGGSATQLKLTRRDYRSEGGFPDYGTRF